MRDLFFYEVRNASHELRQKKQGKGTDENTVRLLTKVVNDVIGLSYKARKEGLLALEEHALAMPKDGYEGYLKQLVMLVVDGTWPDEVEEIGMYRYFSDEVKDAEALAYLMCLNGMLGMQAGENPRITEEKLIAMVPSDVASHILEARAAEHHVYTFTEVTEEDKERIEEFCNYNSDITNKDEGYFIIKLAEYTIEELRDREIQLLLMHMDTDEVKRLVFGLNARARKRIFDNFSKRLAVMILEDLQRINTMEVKYITNSATKWLDYLTRFSAEGRCSCPEGQFLKQFYYYLKEGETIIPEDKKQYRKTRLWELMDEYKKSDVVYITGRAERNVEKG